MSGATVRSATAAVGGQPPAVPARRVRIVGVDAVRGVALLGMIAVHVLPETTTTGQQTWSYAIFNGRASAAFAVLAGLGIAFMTGRARVGRSTAVATVAALTVRALAIGAVGLALGHTDASVAAVILPAFAVLYLLMIPLVFLPTWAVAVAGMATAVGGPVLSHVLRPDLPQPTPGNPTFGHLVDDPLRLLTELSLTGTYPALPWLAYLCAGLVIGRLSLTGTTVALGLLATGLLLSVTAWTASSTLLHRYGGLDRIMAAVPGSGLTVEQTRELLTLGGDGTTPTSSWWWLAVDAAHTGTPPDLVGTTGIAVALLGVMLLAGTVTRPWWRRLVAVVRMPLAAAGGMPLTFYTAHIVFISSGYDVLDPVPGYLAQVAAVLVIGFIWRGTNLRGPLEAVVAGLAALARRWATPASRRPSFRLAAAGAPIGENAMDATELSGRSAGPTGTLGGRR